MSVAAVERLRGLSKDELVQMTARAREGLAKFKEKSAIIAERGLGAVQTVGSGFVTGVLRGRYGDANGELLIPKTDVPADLAAGVALALPAVVGLYGKASEHVLKVGEGILAGYAAIEGVEIGRKMKIKAA